MSKRAGRHETFVLVGLLVGCGAYAAQSRAREARADAPEGPHVADTPRPRAARAGAVWVPGGAFYPGARGGTAPRLARVGAFWIDRAEVSSEAYARCVAAGRCEAATRPLEGASPSGPVTGVTYEQAERYCGYAGGRLPTESEWEFAARGSDGRSYPWGERAPDCDLAQSAGCGTGPSRAGAHPAGRSVFGAEDMAGNVAEWASDDPREAGDGDAGVREAGADAGAAGAGRAARHATRGGAFDGSAAALRVFARAPRDAGEARYDTGVRCAYGP